MTLTPHFVRRTDHRHDFVVISSVGDALNHPSELLLNEIPFLCLLFHLRVQLLFLVRKLCHDPPVIVIVNGIVNVRQRSWKVAFLELLELVKVVN